MKKPKLGKPSLKKLKPTKRGILFVFRFVLLALITIYSIVTIAVAAPKVEQIKQLAEPLGFNLVQKEYSKKTYILELKLSRENKDQIDSKLEKTKNVLSKRLHRLGVEEFKIEETNPKDPKVDTQYVYRYLRVIVKTSLKAEEIDNVVTARGFIRIYTLKSDFNYEDENNQIAQYFIENYDPTPFTRYNFRTFYFKKLATTDGSEAYFAIFKSWPFQDPSFKAFLEKYAGKKIGIAIDGIVNQVTVPYEFSKEYQNANSSNTQAAKPIFAFGVAQDKRSADISNIVFNSGVIPLQYAVIDQKLEEIETTKLDSLQISLLFIAWFAVIMVFIKIRKQKSVLEIASVTFTLVLLMATYLSIYKLGQFPIDLERLIFEFGFVALFTAELVTSRVQKRFISTVIIVILGVLAILGIGLVDDIARDLLLLGGLALALNYLVEYYLINMNAYLLNE